MCLKFNLILVKGTILSNPVTMRSKACMKICSLGHIPLYCFWLLNLHRRNTIPRINIFGNTYSRWGQNWLLGQENEACERENSNGSLERFFLQTHFKMPCVVFLSWCLIVLTIYGKVELHEFTLLHYTQEVKHSTLACVLIIPLATELLSGYCSLYEPATKLSCQLVASLYFSAFLNLCKMLCAKTS
jgi:hypothetical protein